jgi:hypothetical protein
MVWLYRSPIPEGRDFRGLFYLPMVNTDYYLPSHRLEERERSRHQPVSSVVMKVSTVKNGKFKKILT